MTEATRRRRRLGYRLTVLFGVLALVVLVFGAVGLAILLAGASLASTILLDPPRQRGVHR